MFKRSMQFILTLSTLFFALNCMALDTLVMNKLFHTPNDPSDGNPNASVTVAEFFDYECSHCVEMAPIVSAIAKENPNVRFVFKEFPIFGETSDFAARASLAANKQGKYLNFNHILFSTEHPLTEESILAAAKKAGLNMKQLQTDMKSPAIIKQLHGNIALAQTLKVNGTPAFFFVKTKDNSNYNSILGSMSKSEMQNAINITNS